MARSAAVQSYGIIRLHNRCDNAWAVIANENGAILVDGRQLMMRLTRDDALRIADAATRAAIAMSSPAIAATRH